MPLRDGSRNRKGIEKEENGSATSGVAIRKKNDLLLAKQELNQLHRESRELLEQGKYREAFESYAEYGDSMGKIKGLIGAEAAIVEGARKYEELMFWYEAGNLYLMAGNFLNNEGVFPDAGEFFLRAAEALEKSKEKDLTGVITGCYAAAAHALRESKATAESEKAIMKGVFVATGEQPLEVESNALKVLRTGDLRSASDMFERAASVYQRAIRALSDLTSTIRSGSQAIDIKSILHHRAAQNFLASASALSRLNDKLGSIKESIGKSAHEYVSAVINFTPLFSVGEPHKEDYRRYSYDIMMAAALRILLGTTEDIETLKEQLSSIGPKQIKRLSEGKYLDIALTLIKTGKIGGVVNDLREVPFGNMEEVKGYIIELLSKK